MVHAYWLIGREIVEVEQAGKERADYGEEVVKRLADRLSNRFGKGFSYPSVKRMKQFYLTFPEGWATRELERQVASLLYERLAKSREKEQVLAGCG